jgi:hypothetical protein
MVFSAGCAGRARVEQGREHAPLLHTDFVLCKVIIEMLYLNLCLAARSKAWVCGHWLAGIAGSNPPGGMECIVCEQLEVPATG